MQFINRNRKPNQTITDDPVSSVANLFDVSVVFIVALFFAMFVTTGMVDVFNPQSELTITKKDADGNLHIVTKKGREIKIEKLTPSTSQGKGVRLGTAYKLENGKIIYVPED